MATATQKKLIATKAGERLDIFLAKQLPQFSRSFWKRFLLSTGVEVAGERITQPQYKLKPGVEIVLLETELPEIEPDTAILAREIPLSIVYEDASVLVINKPVGLVVHPAAGHRDDTLANGVKFYLQQKGEDNFPANKVGLVHRIDGPTSGVIMIAKDPSALDFLSAQFAQRQVKKYYLALVAGNFQVELSVSKPLGRDRYQRQKFSGNLSNSKLRTARTEFQLLASAPANNASLLLARPITGRTHQIRVHLSESGFPILGDATYRGAQASRLMLHALALEITLPSGELKNFVALPGADFTEELNSRGISAAILKHALAEKANIQS